MKKKSQKNEQKTIDMNESDHGMEMIGHGWGVRTDLSALKKEEAADSAEHRLHRSRTVSTKAATAPSIFDVVLTDEEQKLLRRTASTNIVDRKDSSSGSLTSWLGSPASAIAGGAAAGELS